MSPWASLRELRPARLPRGRRAGGRRGDSRWELTPSAAGMRELTVKLHQHYETPAAVMDFVRREWRPTFDAMATPFSAICGAYATLEDDVLRCDAVPTGSVVYVNQPAWRYAHLEPGPPASAERISMRTCRVCGSVRVLPRWAGVGS